MGLKSFWKLNIFAWLSVFFLCTTPLFAAGPDVYPFAVEKDRQRFEALTGELRCLVCQNQSLADSDAPLAKDLRQKVYLMVQEEKSDEEIKQFLVSRYGEFILFSPPLRWATGLLWGFPAILLALIFGSVALRKGKI